MPCRVLEHLASDLPRPVYLLNEGNVYAECYHVIATEDELVSNPDTPNAPLAQ